MSITPEASTEGRWSDTRVVRVLAWTIDAVGTALILLLVASEVLSRLGPFASRTVGSCHALGGLGWIPYAQLAVATGMGVLVGVLAWTRRWKSEGLLRRSRWARVLVLACLVLVPVLGGRRVESVKEECRLQDLRADVQLIRNLVERERNTRPPGVDDRGARANVLHNVESIVCPRRALASGYEAVEQLRDQLHNQWLALRSEISDPAAEGAEDDMPPFVRAGLRCGRIDTECNGRFVRAGEWTNCFPRVLRVNDPSLPAQQVTAPAAGDAGVAAPDGSTPSLADAATEAQTTNRAGNRGGAPSGRPSDGDPEAGGSSPPGRAGTDPAGVQPSAPTPFHIDPGLEVACVAGALAYAPAAAPYCGAARSVLESLLTYLADRFNMSPPDRERLQRWLDALARGMMSGSPTAGVLTILRETGNTGGVDPRLLDGFTFALGGVPPDLRAAMLPDGTLPVSGGELPLAATDAYQALQAVRTAGRQRQNFATACTDALAHQTEVNVSNRLRDSIRQACPNSGGFAVPDAEYRSIIECVFGGSRVGPAGANSMRPFSMNVDQIHQCVGALPLTAAPGGRAPAATTMIGDVPTPAECARLLAYRDHTLREAFDSTWATHDEVVRGRARLVDALEHWQRVASRYNEVPIRELVDAHRYLYRQLRFVLDPLVAYHRRNATRNRPNDIRPLVRRLVDAIRESDAAANAEVDDATRRSAGDRVVRILETFADIAIRVAISQQALEQLQDDRQQTDQLRRDVEAANVQVRRTNEQLRAYDAGIAVARADLTFINAAAGEVEAYIRQHCTAPATVGTPGVP